MTTTPNNDTPRVGDTIEISFTRTVYEDIPGRLCIRSGTDRPEELARYLRSDCVITVKERAPEPMPTAPGLYVARDDLANLNDYIPPIFYLDSDGEWVTTPSPEYTNTAAQKAHTERGGLVRLSPEDAPRFSDEELAVLREVLDEAEGELGSGHGWDFDRARIAQARRILGLVPAEGSEK